MRKIVRLELALIFMTTFGLVIVPWSAHAGFKERLLRIVGQLVESIDGIPASIDFRNETDETIYVVMDTNRENHIIAPKGQATFSKANIGDAPTFRVYSDTDHSKCLYSKRVDIRTSPHSSFGYRNGKF